MSWKLLAGSSAAADEKKKIPENTLMGALQSSKTQSASQRDLKGQVNVYAPLLLSGKPIDLQKAYIYDEAFNFVEGKIKKL